MKCGGLGNNHKSLTRSGDGHIEVLRVFKAVGVQHNHSVKLKT